MDKPELSWDEINKFVKYLECCEDDLSDVIDFSSCVRLLICDLRIYQMRLGLKGGEKDGSKG